MRVPLRDTIDVPIPKGGEIDEVLEVDLNDLLGNETAIMEVLTTHRVAPAIFLQFAFEYRKRSIADAEIEKMLQQGALSMGDEVTTNEIVLLHALAALLIAKIKNLKPDSQPCKDLVARTATLINRAERINRADTATIVIKGVPPNGRESPASNCKTE
jgi:hypothetical protein